MSRNSSWGKRAILALVVLGGVLLAIPQMFPPRIHSCTNACIANLKQIQGAIEQWALETKRSTNDLVSITDISGSPTNYIRQLINREMTCPAGGTYSVTTFGEVPRCSVAGHTL